jgi:hypothetical protein
MVPWLLFRLRRGAWWLFGNVNLGPLAPHVLGFSIGRRGKRVR